MTEAGPRPPSDGAGDPLARLPLTPAVWHILLALADDERHGYAIMREIAQRTAGRTRLGPGTLYGTLKRLLDAGLVAESGERPDPVLDDERRRYYRLTDFGRRVAQAEAQRLEEMVDSARRKRLLEGAGRPSAPGGAAVFNQGWADRPPRRGVRTDVGGHPALNCSTVCSALGIL